jgi:Leucine-rich repeat (LRR) protein
VNSRNCLFLFVTFTHSDSYVLTSMRRCNLMMGNITSLNLSSNRLTNVEGLDKLYSLENLFINNNQIQSLSEIVSIAQLPQLMRLDVAGNPVVEEGE